MKKFITFLFFSAIFCTVFAQRNNFDKRHNSVYQHNNYRGNERAGEIRRINNEYNFKISHINYDPRLTRREKRRAIKILQKQRAFEISRTNARFNNYGYNRNRNDAYNKNYDRATIVITAMIGKIR
jgi:hypothetical protein